MYKITDETIKAMINECPEAEKVLRKGFPEAFREKWVLVDPSRIDVKIDRWSNDGSFRTIVQVDGRGIGVISQDGLRSISSMYRGEYSKYPSPSCYPEGRLSVYEKK